ncbi:MAG: metallophosphoesterase [Myxococcales bacterium]|nr:metallophosphoesterase [Myxococcales bacterium]
MRTMVIMRGAPGAGKSTFLRAQKLEPFTVCPDEYRLRLAGLEMTPEGDLGISQKKDALVWPSIWQDVETKMRRGELIVLDATFQRGRDFKEALQLAEQYDYTLHGIDFTDVPLEVARTRNRQRETYKIVPDRVLDRAYENFANNPNPPQITWHKPSAFEQVPFLKAMDIQPVDLSTYKAVVHVGDIHSCWDPLQSYFQEGLRDDFFYIFIGDFLDRGLQTKEVIHWMMETLLDRENVVLLYGNHELYLRDMLLGQMVHNTEFSHITQPALHQAGYGNEEIGRLVSQLQDMLMYTYGERRVLATHAGIARIPENLLQLPSETYWKGSGPYDHPVDQVFHDNMTSQGWLQVHGHRNPHKRPFEASPSSYNLEGQVEFGGHLRILEFHQDGRAVCVEIKNETFRDPRVEALGTTQQTDPSGFMDPALLSQLEAHDLVRTKRFESVPHIRSFNFTSKAFYTRQWDDINTIARGLFVGDDGRIVARSYEKFFNLHERPETQLAALEKSLIFPVTLWVKENGYLGIMGYNHYEDSLFFASKSTPDGEYAEVFRKLFQSKVSSDAQELCKEITRKQGLSLVFEVIEPHWDPHPIAYDEPQLILLDGIYREDKFRRLDHEKLVYIGKMLGLPIKERGPTLRDWQQFMGWYDATQEQGRNYQWRGRQIEGFVVEDAEGFQFKIKLPYYSFWKRMRGLAGKIRSFRVKSKDINDLDDYTGGDPEAEAFFAWAREQTDEILSEDIVRLRERFYLAMRNNTLPQS